MQAMIPTSAFPSSSSNGVRLVSADGRELAFRGATVHVRAQGGLAVVVLTQRFANPHAEPLSVRYTMPLPADAAVRGYSFLIGGKLIRGEVDKKHRARERFEEAVASGRTAGIVEQERSSVFNQELGNIPPGEELVAMLELDQKLEWLDDGQWSWRFPTVVGPRYLGVEGRVQDAARVAVDVVTSPRTKAPTVELVLHVLDAIEGELSSPTHALAVSRGEGTEIQLAQGALLDRDISVRWPVAQQKVGLALQVARPEAARPTSKHSFGLLSVVPPSPTARPKAMPRDLIFLLDASGSMYGTPIQQAKALMKTLIHTLEDADQLELISFGDRPHRWQRGAVRATTSAKKEALAWVERLQAEGGTEMRSGILEALKPLRGGSQRQVVLITDGLIGFENEIVATLHEKLPEGCRLHTVGVGSSVNRSLTGPAARAGHGVEVILDIDGNVAEATRQLLARTCAPLVTDLVLEGSALQEHAPAKLPDLFAGAPALLSLKLDPAGGKLRVRGKTPAGPWSTEVTVPAQQPGEGSPSIAALYGRERVEDLEALWAKGRDQATIDRQIEQTGLDFQIASRLTSWVAITEQRTVDPEAKRRAENVPQELPYGMSAESLGLRAPTSAQAAQGLSLGLVDEEEKVVDGRFQQASYGGDDADQPETRDGVLFSLKELVSLEQERVKAEEPTNAPARHPMPISKPAAPPPAQAPMPRASGAAPKKIELRARLGMSSDKKSAASDVDVKENSSAPVAPASMASPYLAPSAETPQGGSDQPEMFGSTQPFSAMPPSQMQAPQALRSRRRWPWLALLLLIAALVYWFFLRR